MIYLTEAQVSEKTGFAIQTLRNWRHNRRGPNYLKIGHSVRYLPEEIHKFMTKQKINLGENR